MGAHVIFACRDEQKTLKIISDIQKKHPKAKCEFIKLDLTDLQSVSDCVNTFKSKKIPLDVLINNAGVGNKLWEQKSTKQGFELMFGVNYLGHYLLNRLLVDEVVKSKGRVILVSSVGHFWTYVNNNNLELNQRTKHPLKNMWNPFSTIQQYGYTKLCQILHTLYLHKLYHQQGIDVNVLHPGYVYTNLCRDIPFIVYQFIKPIIWSFFVSMEEGCETIVYLASNSQVSGTSGKYFVNCKPSETRKEAKNEEMAKELWEWSEEQVKSFLK